MRCNNCGWDNPDHLSQCEKCGNGLQAQGGGYVPVQAPVNNYNKTVGEASAFPDMTEGTQVDMGGNCKKCGYPLRVGTSKCPNCGWDNQAVVVQQQGVNNTPAMGTVNPWVQVKTRKCTLSPVAQEGVDTPEPIHLKEEHNDLNRSNLDAENPTITSKTQAHISYENGKWYIEDRSSQHTTFLYVQGKTELHDGDIILMGNRQFVFKAE